jgi:hypothetical protein
MADQDRLTQLRVLMDRLERMPASPDRDWMLAEVRSRAVDIDTGIAPRPLRPLESGVAPPPAVAKSAAPARAPAPAPAPAKKPAGRPARPATRTAPAKLKPQAMVPAPAWEATVPEARKERDVLIDLLELDGLLSLDDVPPAPADDGEAKANRDRPWAGGLRG